MKNPESINRKEFLMKIGLSGAALMAALTSCSTNDTNVTPSTSGSFTIDLSSSTYSALTKVGGYVKVNSVIVARISSENTSAAFAAIARICPHEKKDKIVYDSSAKEFRCTEHDWYFKTTGKGDGNSSTTGFTVALSGTTLTIS
jgi:cytochrome b6-f complex iron-sulfur subunit